MPDDWFEDAVKIVHSLMLITIYGCVLPYAWRLYRLPIATPGWKRAWFGVFALALLVFARRSMIIVDPFIHGLDMRSLLLGKVFAVLVPLLAAIVLLGLVYEMSQIFLHRLTIPANGPVPVAQIEIDRYGHILSWNAAAEHLLGWTAAEVLKAEMAPLLIPEDFMWQGQPAREAHRAGLQHYRETGEIAILDQQLPLMSLHKDGTQIPIWLYITAHLGSRGTTFLGSMTPRGPAGEFRQIEATA